MRFQLFDADDLKAAEDTLVRAMVRAMRIVAREGLLRPDWRPPPPVSETELEAKRRQRQEEEFRALQERGRHIREEAERREAEAQEAKAREAEARETEAREAEARETEARNKPAEFGVVGAPSEPPFLKPLDFSSKPNGLTEDDVRRALETRAPDKAEPPPARGRRRREKSPFKTVADRPNGYVTTDEARKLIDLQETSAKAVLSQWMHKLEVPTVIVANVKPPTKGLPGRLHVDKAAVIARDKQRQQNSRSGQRLQASA